MRHSPHIAVLLVCYNRKATTLTCLKHLFRSARDWQLSVVLFDDASPDGTAAEVCEQYPDVLIVHGAGTSFWNGGLYQAWREALEMPVEGFLWLNDDVLLDEDAFGILAGAISSLAAERRSKRFLIAGSTRSQDGAITYKGYQLDISPWSIGFVPRTPDGTIQQVDTFDGNFVYVPREVVAAIGLNDPRFLHNLGDRDYGLRAGSAGITSFLLPRAIGICDGNQQKCSSGYATPGMSLRQQWSAVNTHHGLPFRSWWRFTRRHSRHWFLLHFLVPYRFLFVPPLVLEWRKLFKRSKAGAALVMDKSGAGG